jgi:hypothetical protein
MGSQCRTFSRFGFVGFDRANPNFRDFARRRRGTLSRRIRGYRSGHISLIVFVLVELFGCVVGIEKRRPDGSVTPHCGIERGPSSRKQAVNVALIAQTGLLQSVLLSSL